MFKSTTTVKTILKTIGVDDKKVSAAFEKAGEAFDETFKAFDGVFESVKSSSCEDDANVQTEHVNVKVKGKAVVINGDVTEVTVNGKKVTLGA